LHHVDVVAEVEVGVKSPPEPLIKVLGVVHIGD